MTSTVTSSQNCLADRYSVPAARSIGGRPVNSRSGLDWSDKYRPVLEAALKSGARSALLDGEMIASDERGASDFSALQGAISRWPTAVSKRP